MSDRHKKLARRSKRKAQKGKDRTDLPYSPAVLERLLAKVPAEIHGEYRSVFIEVSRVAEAAGSRAELFDCITEVVDRACQEWAQLGRSACKAGCDWCCQQDVLIAPFERHVVVTEMRRLGLESHVASRLEFEGNSVWVPSEKKKMPISPCPFLQDHQCLIYDKRPLACRTQFSTDAARCERAYHSAKAGMGDETYPRAMRPAAVGIAARKAIDRKNRLSMREELHRALAGR